LASKQPYDLNEINIVFQRRSKSLVLN